MLSELAQGYAAWDVSAKLMEENNGLPILYLPTDHRHGVTVKSARRLRKHKIITVEEVDGSIAIPKTYLTRKGALVLYSSESEDDQQKELERKLNKPENILKVLERLGNVRRLVASILFLNDTQDTDPDISIADERNEVFMGFLRTLDNVLYKQKMQPGCDLHFYLRILRMHARKLSTIAGGELAQQIDTLLATPNTGSRPSTTATTSTRVLSSAKLTASLKSDTYMGRKTLYPVPDTLSHDLTGTNTPYSTVNWPMYPPVVETVSNTLQQTLEDANLGESENCEKLPGNHAGDGHAATINLQRNIKSARLASDKSRHAAHRSKSVGDVTEVEPAAVGERRAESRASAATSSSMFDDPTLYEEVDISLPGEASGLEPDSDLENEYFKSVLNIDDLPRPAMPDGNMEHEKTDVHTPTDRHLTNTPDVERSFIGVDIVRSQPMTPEITLRSGNSTTFNILQSQVAGTLPPVDVGSSHQKSRKSYSSHGNRTYSPIPEQKRATTSLSDCPGAGGETISGLEFTNQHELVLLAGRKSNSQESENSEQSKMVTNSRTSNRAMSARNKSSGNGKSIYSGHTDEKDGHSPAWSANTANKEANSYLPDLVKESVTPDEERITPILLSRPVSEGSRETGLSSSQSDLRIGSDSFKSETPVVAVPKKKESLSDLKISDKMVGSLHLPEPMVIEKPPLAKKGVEKPTKTTGVKRSKSTISSQIHGVGSKQKSSGMQSQVSSKAKSSSPAVPSNIMEIKGDPKLDILQLETESVPEKPPPSVLYRLPSTPLLKIPEVPKPSKIRDVDKDALERAEKMKEEEQRVFKVLMKDPKEVTAMLSSNMAEEFDESGLTLAEMELAQEMLTQKLTAANKGIEQNLSVKVASGQSEDKRPIKRKTSRSEAKPVDESKAKRKELMEKRELVRQAKKQDQKNRLAEKKALQEMISTKAKEKQAFLEEEERLIREVRDREEHMRAIAEEARQQEEEARKALAESRRIAKEEREQRRKEELERRKEEAIRRRGEQKRMQDAARQKELDMLEKISDAETVRELREAERKRREDEEWKLQAKLEEEERSSRLQAEDEEARMSAIEREAEEHAMTRLIEERLEAEMKEKELEQQRKELQAIEDEKRAILEGEQGRFEEELRLQEEREELEREAERQRILELRRLEGEAQERMRQEIEERRAHLMGLRQLNIEKKKNLETIKKNQAYTKPWVFSYYVHWPRESYERLMGGGGSGDKTRRPTPKNTK